MALIGVTLPQFTSDAARLRSAVERAEAVGLDSLWVFDHLWPLSGGKQRPIFECWTTLAWAAALTSRISVGTLVTRSSLRNEVLLAKMAATVAEIAPGRLIVAIGSGDEASRGENEAYGLPYWSGDERIAQLKATVETVRGYLNGTGGPIPRVGTAPAPPVWLAGRSDEARAAAAAVADGWNGWGGVPEEWARAATSVRGMAGERPLTLTWGGVVVMDRDDGTARERAAARRGDAHVVGGPARVAEALGGYAAAGAEHIVVTLPNAGETGAYELLAETVAPAVRAIYPRGV